MSPLELTHLGVNHTPEFFKPLGLSICPPVLHLLLSEPLLCHQLPPHRSLTSSVVQLSASNAFSMLWMGTKTLPGARVLLWKCYFETWVWGALDFQYPCRLPGTSPENGVSFHTQLLSCLSNNSTCPWVVLEHFQSVSQHLMYPPPPSCEAAKVCVWW